MLRVLLAVPGGERRWMTTDNNVFGKSPLAYIAEGSPASLLRLQAYLSAWLWS